MATASQQLMGLTEVLGNLTKLTGGTATTTTNQTTQSGVTEEGIQRIIQQMLAGPGGVKDVSSRARGAGLYNSTTELQNLNDLNTRVAGEAAKLSAPTTTTQTQEVEMPGISMGGVAPIAALMGTGLLGNAINGVANYLSPAAGITASPNYLGTGVGSAVGNIIPSITSSTAPALGGNLLASLDGLAPAISGGATQIAGNAAGSATANLGGSLGSFLGEGVPLAGNFLSGLFGDSDAVKNPMNLAMSSAMGAAALGPVGLAAAPLAALGGSLFGKMSIVCTALQARGLLDKAKYAKGQVYLQSLHKFTVLGYYWLAADWARKINEGDIGTIAKCLPWAYSRTELIAKPSLVNHFRYFRGTLTKFIGQPLCFLIGAVLSAKGKVADDYVAHSLN